jgi:hypothetical protein
VVVDIVLAASIIYGFVLIMLVRQSRLRSRASGSSDRASIVSPSRSLVGTIGARRSGANYGGTDPNFWDQVGGLNPTPLSKPISDEDLIQQLAATSNSELKSQAAHILYSFAQSVDSVEKQVRASDGYSSVVRAIDDGSDGSRPTRLVWAAVSLLATSAVPFALDKYSQTTNFGSTSVAVLIVVFPALFLMRDDFARGVASGEALIERVSMQVEVSRGKRADRAARSPLTTHRSVNMTIERTEELNPFKVTSDSWDRLFVQMIDKVCVRIPSWLSGLRIALISTLFGVGGSALVATGHHRRASVALVCGLIIDAFDGRLIELRLLGRRRSRSLLIDYFLDRFVDIVLGVGGIVYFLDSDRGLAIIPALFALLSLLGSYVRAEAGRLGLDCTSRSTDRWMKVAVLSLLLMLSSPALAFVCASSLALLTVMLRLRMALVAKPLEEQMGSSQSGSIPR